MFIAVITEQADHGRHAIISVFAVKIIGLVDAAERRVGAEGFHI